MKKILLILSIAAANYGFSQLPFPSFLQGTWKMEGLQVYERWDQLNDHTLKGVSYKLSENGMEVSEYIEISGNKGKIQYTASVIGQNNGAGIPFRLVQADSLFVFENLKHDFPNRIVYKRISDNLLNVTVSGNNGNMFNYELHRETTGKNVENNTSNPNYDAALATQSGADEYGMKPYVFVILKTGSNPSVNDKSEISEHFRGHLDNINRLVAEEKMVIAGPMGKNDKNYRGIFILSNVKDLEEARELLQTDPAIKAGLLDVELYDWYGSAALPEYLPYSDKVWKSKP